MPPLLLSTEKLGIVRGDRVLLSEISLALHAGELLHLRGRNGAGKTSLLEVLAGLRLARSGSVSRMVESHWLGHKNGLNLALSPLENLEFWCGLNEADSKEIVPALQRLSLARWRHRPCRTLSAGQKRRAAMARLLLASRPLWLLDEPLSGLDTEGLACFAGLLDEHLKQGGGAIVTSHQPLPVAGPIRELELAS